MDRRSRPWVLAEVDRWVWASCRNLGCATDCRPLRCGGFDCLSGTHRLASGGVGRWLRGVVECRGRGVGCRPVRGYRWTLLPDRRCRGCRPECGGIVRAGCRPVECRGCGVGCRLVRGEFGR